MSVAGEIVVELKLEDKDMVVSVKNAGAVLRQFQGTLNTTAASVKRMEQAGDSLGTKFRHLVMTMGNLRFVAMDINDIFLRLPASILKNAGELERMQVLMTGLSKEMTEVGRAADGVRDFRFVTGMAKTAPFEIGALSDAFVKLKTAGMDPANFSMKALADSVAKFGGSGESLKRASVAIQQMAGKGVISMEELRQQLGEAVPTAMQDMADGMGMTMAELGKIVQTGTLQAGPALAKMFVQMRVNNEGASAAMMQTWSGMLSQLQTEWQLTSKFIADNGFGDAAKKAVGEITTMLRSDEFVKFGRESGQALGEVVQGVTSLAEFLVKYRQEIGMAAQAWLAYKVIFSGIAPLARGLNSTYGENIARIREEIAAASASATAKRNYAVQEAIYSKNALYQKQLDLAKTLTGHQSELASVRARNAAIIAEDTRTRAVLAGLENRAFVPGLNDSAARAKNMEYLRQLATQNGVLTTRERELSAAVAATGVSLNAAGTAAAKKTAEVARLTSATAASRVATMAASAATTALSGAMNLLGGPIGLVITALMGLAYWYNQSANAAEEAQARIKRANLGMADSKDAAALQQSVDSARRELEATKRMAAGEYKLGGSYAGEKKSAEDRKKDAEAVTRAEKAYSEAVKVAAAATKSVEETAGRERVDSINLSLSRISKTYQDNAALEIAKIKNGAAARLAGMKEGSAEWKAEHAKIIAEQQAAMVRGIKRRIDLEAKAEASANKGALQGGPNRSADLQLAQQASERRKQLESELAAIQKAISSEVDYKKKGGTKGSGAPAEIRIAKDDEANKIKTLMENIAENRAKLDEELQSLTQSTLQADGVAAELDKIDQKFTNGDFDYYTGSGKDRQRNSATGEELAGLKAATREILEMKRLLTDKSSLADLVRTTDPAYRDAVESLLDPGSASPKGGNEKGFDKFLASLKAQAKDIPALFASLGTSVDEVRNKMKTMDNADVFRAMNEETKLLNASLVNDSREASVAKMRADNTAYENKIRLLIAERQASGADAAEIQRMYDDLAANIEARSAALGEKAKTPMQKMADEWKNSTRNMEEATARWGNSAIDQFVNVAKTGKFEWGALADQILTDMIKISMQKAASGAVTSGMNWMTTLAASFFADGGIMSSGGSLPLRKYAAGGVANSPQVAVYGEGSMNEAFVPLPDGRSIPVTMTGGQGGGVQINITVNRDGGSNSNASGENADAYKKMGERLRMVVQEELAKESRPGGRLYK